MAVIQITTIQRFMGLAADTKPASPPVGSRFWETDTATRHVYDGVAWRNVPRFRWP